jgi:hypothetical protein
MFRLIVAPLLLAIPWLCGCDTGRLGVYRVSLAPPGEHVSAVGVSGAEELDLKRVVDGIVSPLGFQLRPDSEYVWAASQAWISLSKAKTDGDWTLEFRAFGTRGQVKHLERAEEKCVAALMQRPGLTVTPLPPPVPRQAEKEK